MASWYSKGFSGRKLTWRGRLRFGKYSGCVVREVVRRDPQYLWWAIHNVRGINVSEKVRERLWEAIRMVEQRKLAWRACVSRSFTGGYASYALGFADMDGPDENYGDLL